MAKKFKIEKEGGEDFNPSHPLNELFNCIKFWNQEGEECYKMNGKDHETYEDFMFKCMASDCNVFVNADEAKGQYITGTGGHHLWVARKSDNERILFIHF